uniref:lactate utilization protein n=1 Tax=Eubacterium cellulosolvens TaxID=29322 RepID=UPI0031018C19
MEKTMREKRDELFAQKVIKGLASRNITGYYAATAEEAKEIALSLIPEGSKVTNGGVQSAKEIGLLQALEEGNYEYCNREKYTDKKAAALFAYTADFYISSCNAMTDDGILVNIDGNSNRVSAIAFGPEKVIFIVGMNKVTSDFDSALKRARNEAAPINAMRFDIDTPCKKTGSCANCKSPDTICCNFMVTRYSRHKDRMHVILVDENLGF